MGAGASPEALMLRTSCWKSAVLSSGGERGNRSRSSIVSGRVSSDWRTTSIRLRHLTTRSNNSADPVLRAKFEHAVRLNRSGRVAAAIALLRGLTKRFPRSPSVLGYLAGIHQQTGRPEKAVPLFRAVLALSPTSEVASRGLVHSLLDMGNTPAAITELERFLAIGEAPEFEELLAQLKKQTRSPRPVTVRT